MDNVELIVLPQATVLPQFRDEVVAAAALKPTLAEPGCVAFLQTCRPDDPNTLVFFEVFASSAAEDRHMQQAYVKQFFAAIHGKLVAPPVITRLRHL